MSAAASCATKYVFGFIHSAAALDITGKLGLATGIATSLGFVKRFETIVNILGDAIRPGTLTIAE